MVNVVKMSRAIKNLNKQLKFKLHAVFGKWYLNHLNLDKKDLIDFAFLQQRFSSFADLGGVWGVDGAYTFYTLDNKKVTAAYLVDTDLTNKVIE